jgi:hypothetical protein
VAEPVGVGTGGKTNPLTTKVAPATSCGCEFAGTTLLTHIGKYSPSPGAWVLFKRLLN